MILDTQSSAYSPRLSQPTHPISSESNQMIVSPSTTTSGVEDTILRKTHHVRNGEGFAHSASQVENILLRPYAKPIHRARHGEGFAHGVSQVEIILLRPYAKPPHRARHGEARRASRSEGLETNQRRPNHRAPTRHRLHVHWSTDELKSDQRLIRQCKDEMLPAHIFFRFQQRPTPRRCIRHYKGTTRSTSLARNIRLRLFEHWTWPSD